MQRSPTAAQTISLTTRVHSVLKQTDAWIRCFGGRLAGTEPARKMAEELGRHFQRSGARISLESFETHPDAFYRFYQIDVLLYLAGVILLWMNLPWLAGVVLLFMIAAAGLEFGWYIELYDRLYPRKRCSNVSAVLEPQGDVRQQLILCAHHDAALELNFLTKNQKLYGLKIIIPDLFRFLGLVTALSWGGIQSVTGSIPPFVLPAKLLLVVGIYFLFTKFFLAGPNITPGAGDNLVASAMLVDLAEALADSKMQGRSILEHTRLVFVSFDAEEAGLRGSRAWVKAHRSELELMPIYALNIDSIYTVKDLQFLISDLNSHVALDSAVARRCVEIARAEGFEAKLAKMVFAGGGTDAAELARAGVRATTMIAMSTSLIRDGLVYHTMRDTVDAIDPDAVAACLTVAEKLALALDQDLITRATPAPANRA